MKKKKIPCGYNSYLVWSEKYQGYILMPTKLEVFAVLRTATIPEGYWKSGQRILCYDTPADGKTQIGSTHFGTGKYYTYVPNGAIVKAGMKTNYCILPIRTEPLNTQTDKITIEINDQWND